MDTHLSSLIYTNWLDQTVNEFLGLIIICKRLFSLLKNFSFDALLLIFVSLCSCHELIKVCVCRTWRTSWDKLEKWHLQMHIGPNLMKGEKIISICITQQLAFRNTSQGIKLWWFTPICHFLFQGCWICILQWSEKCSWKIVRKGNEWQENQAHWGSKEEVSIVWTFALKKQFMIMHWHGGELKSERKPLMVTFSFFQVKKPFSFWQLLSFSFSFPFPFPLSISWTLPVSVPETFS